MKNSKYAKYSTEQLEGIFTHLTDPEEKELVKKELSSRYYQHYLNINHGGKDQPEGFGTAAPDGPVTEIPATEDVPVDEIGAEDEELPDLVELEPIKLTSPAAPETVAPPTEKASKKYCFIATAAYGSPLAREVALLQHYRDNYLSRTPPGRKFIEAYYRLSPYPAGLISRNKLLRNCARYLLTPLILLIKHHLHKDRK